MIDSLRLKADLMASKLMRENISPVKTTSKKSPKFNQNISQENTPKKSFNAFD